MDNGYLDWSTMVPPSKYYYTYAEMRFSKWIESIRKDVECTFGIMKGRFRILKTGIALHGIEATDKVWMTCCGLITFYWKRTMRTRSGKFRITLEPTVTTRKQIS
mmetsp:Transcript_2588/g.3868  ORF Transcript_2588/g.3868 Transcript_2588/m.3868 type:complete len:105 (-) Transcript_2588:443-757(-)